MSDPTCPNCSRSIEFVIGEPVCNACGWRRTEEVRPRD